MCSGVCRGGKGRLGVRVASTDGDTHTLAETQPECGEITLPPKNPIIQFCSQTTEEGGKGVGGGLNTRLPMRWLSYRSLWHPASGAGNPEAAKLLLSVMEKVWQVQNHVVV